MSFYPPFKYRFEEGDLVYGLSEQRDLYSRNFDHFKSSSTPRNISTIDQYAATNLEIKLQNTYKKQKPINQDDYLRMLSSHPKYKTLHDAQGFCFNDRAIHHHQVIGRKCKAGLLWVSSLQDKASIHFILDGLNISQVVGKSHPLDKHERSFTGVELRWIYRYRYNPMVIKKIQFWLNGSPTTPPWFGKNSELWQQYIPRSDPDWSASLSQLFSLS